MNALGMNGVWVLGKLMGSQRVLWLLMLYHLHVKEKAPAPGPSYSRIYLFVMDNKKPDVDVAESAVPARYPDED